jgi:DNA mismatch repair protein MutS2
MATPATPLLSPATALALELPSLLAVLAELAASDLGGERLAGLAPCLTADELSSRQRRFEEARRLLGERPLVPAFETPVGELLERLDTGRPPINGPDLVRLAVFLRAIREAAAAIRQADPPCPALGELTAQLPDLSELERRIGSVLDRRGGVRDDASPELVTLRRSIRSVRDRLYQELGGYAAEHRETLAEETVPLRGGRLMLMLPAGSRGRLAGLTHGRSGSGKTFYFEPLEMVEPNNTLQQAVEDEEAERQRLLAELVTRARSALGELEHLAETLAELDLLQAACRFADLTGGRLVETSPRHDLALLGARHPLLDPRLAELRERALGQAGHREAVTPLDLSLDPESRVLVVTGPNAGGKTVALKTVGLLAVASQCGLPVPVGAGSRLPLVSRLVAIVGDEQDLLTDRSTFSGRLLRLKEAWEAAGEDSLLLLDELGSGTDPEEGSALSVALLEGLLERHSLAVITTHLTPLAAAALELPGAACAAMELDAATGEPTFRLRPGPPGGSEALGLARRLGLPAEWLDRAEARLGSEHRQLRHLLAEVERIRQMLAETHARAERDAADAETLRRRLEDEHRELTEERRTVGRRLAAELESFRRDTRQRLREEVERVRQKLEAGRRKGLAEEATERLFTAAPELDVPEPEAAGPLVEGEPVRHRTLGWEGTLERLQGSRAEVHVRGKRLRCRADELAPLEDGTSKGRPVRAAGRRRGGVSLTLEDGDARSAAQEIKLLGQRVEPALRELDAYLDQALLSPLEEVRVIHGHGTGRLRDAVRRHLRQHPAVAAQRPGNPDEGGDGATVVRLQRG